MSYRGKSQGSYGNHRSGRSVAGVQNNRSFRAKITDAGLKAPIAKSIEQWMDAPNRFDLPEVDMPKELVSSTNTPDNPNAVYTETDKLKDKAVKPSDKKPWEMAYSEFFDVAGSEYTAGDRFNLVYHGRVPSYLKEVEGKTIWVGEQGATPEERIHRAVIRQALAQGKTVPEEVLKQYPDLKETYVVTNTRYGGTREIEATSPKQAIAKAVEVAGVPSSYAADLKAEKKSVVGVATKGSVEGSSATYNKATGWMAISFSSIPAPELRQEMKANGFRYNPVRKQWVAKWYPYREELAKKYAGELQQVDIKPNWAAKAENAANMASKHEQISNETFNRAEKMSDAIPFGQPILVDHYSARSDRNYRGRIQNTYQKSFEEQKIAEKYQDRAERYGQKATGENPGLIYRRIQKLEADKRKMERNKAEAVEKRSQRGIEWADKWLNEYNNRLTVEREKYKASGGIPIENTKFNPGDRVYTRHGVGTIASISKKTARVRLDPDPLTGREKSIYANSRGESLFSVEHIKEKLTPDQIERYNKAVEDAKQRRSS